MAKLHVPNGRKMVMVKAKAKAQNMKKNRTEMATWSLGPSAIRATSETRVPAAASPRKVSDAGNRVLAQISMLS